MKEFHTYSKSREFPGGYRQVFWLPGHPHFAPSHPAYAAEQWFYKIAKLVTGYSGASAADFHGLPF